MRQRALWLWGGLGAAFFSVLGLACDDPPPPTQTGAFFVQFTDSGIDCNVNNHQTELGTVGATGKPELVADGTNDAAVVCTVKKSGNGFVVSADLDGAATTLQLDVSSLAESQNTIDAAALGQVKYASSETGGNPYSTPQGQECKFWVDTEQGQYIKAGEAWFSFDCGAVISGSESCSVSGYVALKNCTGLPEAEDE
ncbi:MAG: hypothetical protein JNL21_22380 [Myxococcales bacterium]|nr:hypothetical protein [Myxococcales bacterium]